MTVEIGIMALSFIRKHTLIQIRALACAAIHTNKYTFELSNHLYNGVAMLYLVTKRLIEKRFYC